MASIYGPPAHKRRRKRVPAVRTVKLTAMQMFWLITALIVFVTVMVRLEDDEGDPELDDALRRLQLIPRMNENYRPLDPAIFELPKFEPPHFDPLIFEPLQSAERITHKPVPTVTQPLQSAERIPKPPGKTRRTVPRSAPEQ